MIQPGNNLTGWDALIPAEWKSEYDKVFFSLQSSWQNSLSDRAALSAAIDLSKYISAHPVESYPIEIGAPHKRQSIRIQLSYGDKGAVISANTDDIELPAGSYLVILSPLPQLDTDGVREVEARNASYAVAGVLGSLFGHSIAHRVEWEFILNLKDGKISNASEPIVSAQPPDTFSYCSISSLEALKSKLREERNSEGYELAFSLAGRGMQATDPKLRFFDLWSALEILSGGDKALRRSIDTSKRGSQWRTDMLALKAARDKLIHHAIVPQIDARLQRVLVMTIIDVALTRHGIRDDALLAMREAPEILP